MEFNLFEWISVVLCFSLQLTCLLKIKEPKSLRLLMLVLCIGNVLSVLSRNNEVVYYYQLHIRRMISCLVFLWAVGDAVCLPEKPSLALRVPVAGAFILAVRYWPFLAENGPAEMELFRAFALSLAFLTVAIHFVFLIPAGRPVTLALCLFGCLAAEVTGSYAILRMGWMPRFQMCAWAVGMVFLVAYAAKTSGLSHTAPLSPPIPPAGVQAQTAASGSCPERAIRLPLQYRVSHGRRVS